MPCDLLLFLESVAIFLVCVGKTPWPCISAVIALDSAFTALEQVLICFSCIGRSTNHGFSGRLACWGLGLQFGAVAQSRGEGSGLHMRAVSSRSRIAVFMCALVVSKDTGLVW